MTQGSQPFTSRSLSQHFTICPFFPPRSALNEVEQVQVLELRTSVLTARKRSQWKLRTFSYILDSALAAADDFALESRTTLYTPTTGVSIPSLVPSSSPPRRLRVLFKVLLDRLPIDRLPPVLDVLLTTPHSVIGQVAMRMHAQAQQRVNVRARAQRLRHRSHRRGCQRARQIDPTRVVLPHVDRPRLGLLLRRHPLAFHLFNLLLRLGQRLAQDAEVEAAGEELLPLVHEDRSTRVRAYDSEAVAFDDEPDVRARGGVQSGDVRGEVGDEGGERLEGRAAEGLREGVVRVERGLGGGLDGGCVGGLQKVGLV